MNKAICKIPISIGELWDKYTILLIKNNIVTDPIKKKNIEIELESIKAYIQEYPLNTEIQKELQDCNKKLWNIEDLIREKEKRKEFDSEFIELARSVYITNDIRFQIKHKINILFDSLIVETKHY
jgi:hypothetical protein